MNPSKPTQPPLLLNSKEAAAALAISTRTLYTLTKSGKIPCLRIGPEKRYSVKDLELWIETRKRAS